MSGSKIAMPLLMAGVLIAVVVVAGSSPVPWLARSTSADPVFPFGPTAPTTPTALSSLGDPRSLGLELPGATPVDIPGKPAVVPSPSTLPAPTRTELAPAPTVGTAPSTTLKRYHSASLDLTFEYPENWTIDAQAPGRVNIFNYETKWIGSRVPDGVTAQILEIGLLEANESLAKFSERWIGSYSSPPGAPPPVRINIRESSVELRAYAFEEQVLIAIFEKNSRVYAVQISSWMPRYISDINQLISSIK